MKQTAVPGRLPAVVAAVAGAVAVVEAAQEFAAAAGHIVHTDHTVHSTGHNRLAMHLNCQGTLLKTIVIFNKRMEQQAVQKLCK